MTRIARLLVPFLLDLNGTTRGRPREKGREMAEPEPGAVVAKTEAV